MKQTCCVLFSSVVERWITNMTRNPTDSDRIAEYDMKLMDIDSDTLGIPDTDYDARVTMPASEFARIVRDLSLLGESVRIEVSKEGVRFASDGEAANGSVLLKQTEAARAKYKDYGKEDGPSADDDDDDDVKEEEGNDEEKEEGGSKKKKKKVKAEDVEMKGDGDEEDEEGEEFKPKSDDEGEDEQDEEGEEEEGNKKKRKKAPAKVLHPFLPFLAINPPLIFYVNINALALQTFQKSQKIILRRRSRHWRRVN